METAKRQNRVLETLNGTLGTHGDESGVKYFLLSKQHGKLLLIYDVDLEEDLRLNLWKDVKVIGYKIENSNLLVPIEIIPPRPSQTRARFMKNVKKKYSELKSRVPDFQNSLLVVA